MKASIFAAAVVLSGIPAIGSPLAGGQRPPVGAAAFEQQAMDGHISRIRLAVQASGAMDSDRLVRALREATAKLSPGDARRYLEAVELGLARPASRQSIGGTGGSAGKPAGRGVDSPKGLDSPKKLDSARGL